jgi:hypothetical protein
MTDRDNPPDREKIASEAETYDVSALIAAAYDLAGKEA